MKNAVRTAVLLAMLMALFGMIGLLIGGGTGLVIALLVGAATNLFAYWNADKFALRAHNATQVDENNAPELLALVHDLADRAGLPRPRTYVMDEAQPNAFATGRTPDKGAVAVSTGLLNLLSKEELAGVIAHELAHIKNRDTLTMTVAATISGAISSIVNFAMFFGGNRQRPNPIVMILIVMAAPLAAGVIQMAISRSREYEADHDGAEICGNPAWLASALDKIAGGVAVIPNEAAEARPSTAPLFIINPLSGRLMDGLFSTHPKTENRIQALMEQAARMGVSSMGANAPYASLPEGHMPTRKGPWG